MIVINEIEDAIFDWVKQYSELADENILWLNQNIPQPSLPYITLNFLTPFNKTGRDNIDYEESETKFYLRGDRFFVISLQIYGSDSPNIMLKLQRALSLPETIEYWKSKNLAVSIVPLVADTSFVLDTLVEKRQSMDIQFYTTDNIESTISRIEKTEIDYDVSGNAGQIIVN